MARTYMCVTKVEDNFFQEFVAQLFIRTTTPGTLEIVRIHYKFEL
jgi:hypothetical protein